MTHPMEVLIVEDDPSIQSLLAALVARNQIRPVLAGDGNSALALIASRPFAAIVLDLFLPETNGFEVLRHLHCLRPELLPRVVVTTAASESTYRDCSYLSEVRTVIRKPFDIDELEGALLACTNDAGEDANERADRTAVQNEIADPLRHAEARRSTNS